MKLYIHSNTSKRHYKVYPSQMKSTLDEDYEPKGQMYLSGFQDDKPGSYREKEPMDENGIKRNIEPKILYHCSPNKHNILVPHNKNTKVVNLDNINGAAFTIYKDDYQPKAKKSINDLKLVKIDKAFIQKFKWVGESLKRNEIHLDRDDAYAWLTKNDKIVARLYMDNKDYGDGYKWIGMIEVENGYRGNGYGEQVLEFAMNHEHGTALGVHKNNTVALNMYKKHGFKISPESRAKVDSGESNYYLMYLTANS